MPVVATRIVPTHKATKIGEVVIAPQTMKIKDEKCARPLQAVARLCLGALIGGMYFTTHSRLLTMNEVRLTRRGILQQWLVMLATRSEQEE